MLDHENSGLKKVKCDTPTKVLKRMVTRIPGIFVCSCSGTKVGDPYPSPFVSLGCL
jgi:hypothetical protein